MLETIFELKAGLCISPRESTERAGRCRFIRKLQLGSYIHTRGRTSMEIPLALAAIVNDTDPAPGFNSLRDRFCYKSLYEPLRNLPVFSRDDLRELRHYCYQQDRHHRFIKPHYAVTPIDFLERNSESGRGVREIKITF